jgi:hypothetical protein
MPNGDKEDGIMENPVDPCRRHSSEEKVVSVSIDEQATVPEETAASESQSTDLIVSNPTSLSPMSVGQLVEGEEQTWKQINELRDGIKITS